MINSYFQWITINFLSVFFFGVGDGLRTFFWGLWSLNFLFCFVVKWKQKPHKIRFFSLIWWEFFSSLGENNLFSLTVRDLSTAVHNLDTEIQYVLRLHYHVLRLHPHPLKYSDHFCYYVNRLFLPLLRHCVESLQFIQWKMKVKKKKWKLNQWNDEWKNQTKHTKYNVFRRLVAMPNALTS